MPKIRHNSFLISCFLSVLAFAGFLVILFLALRSPMSYQPELHRQFVQIEPVEPTADGAAVTYQTTLADERWGQPVCAVIASEPLIPCIWMVCSCTNIPPAHSIMAG